IETTKQEIEEVIGISAKEALIVSAKSGAQVEQLIHAVVERIPPPAGKLTAPLRALIFDSWFDNYLGVVSLVRIVDGSIKRGQKIRLMSIDKEFLVDQLGFFSPEPQSAEELSVGEVGYIA